MSGDDTARDDIAFIQECFPDALRLAEVASIAARIEPELLRALRLQLFPTIGAEAEADLWFSPLVQHQDPVAMVLLPAVAHLLQRRLKADRDLLAAAWKTIEAIHQPLPPAIRVQEELTWLALQGEAGRPAAEAKLAEILTAMVRDGRDGLAGWGAQALPRLPAELRDYQHFDTLSWAVRLRTPLPGLAAAQGPSAAAEGLAWLLAKGLPEARLGVHLEGDVLHLSAPPSNATYEIAVPVTAPLAVEVIERFGDTERRRTQAVAKADVVSIVLEPPAALPVPLGAPSVDLRTADGQLYTLPRPDPSVELSWPEAVAEVQRLLNALGVASPPLPLDGVANPATRVAVQAFQLDRNLPLDGLLTETLLGALREQVESRRREGQHTVEVSFEYWTGLRPAFLRGATLYGSWDSLGRASEFETSVPMTAFTAADGCPAFRATANLHTDLVGQTLRWRVDVVTADGAASGIAGEIDETGGRDRHRVFTLRRAGQTERYHLTDCRRLGANKLFVEEGREPSIRFSVWSPNARAVELVRGDAASGYIWNDGRGVVEALPMRREDDGIWSMDVSQSPTLRSFASWDFVPYMFRVTRDDGSVAYRTDLFSRCQIGSGAMNPEWPLATEQRSWNGTRQDLDGTKSCSVVTDPERVTELFEQFAWPETRWLSDEAFWEDEFYPGGRPVPTRIEDLVIYELHVDGLGLDRNAPRGTLRDAIDLIEHLCDLGVNAVELMPLSEYQGWAGWGYAPTHHMAIKSSAGGRDQLKHFVRECHRRGLAVLLDVVYCNYGHDGERAQWMYDSLKAEHNIWYWYEGMSSEQPTPDAGYVDNGSGGWAPRYSEETVRRLFISSAAALLAEFHVDGFRCNLTQAIYRDNVRRSDGRSVADANRFGAGLLREWSNTLKLIRPNVFLIAEDHSGWRGVCQPTDEGGLGFDGSWESGFYHQLIGDAQKDPSRARLLNHAGRGDDEPLNMRWFGDTLAAAADRKVVYHASHDEAGNSYYVENGRRVHSARTIVTAVNGAPLEGETRRYAEARVRFVAGVTLLAPGIPLFFMGEEVGAVRPYRYDDFLDNREDYAALRRGSGAALFRFYADVIRLRLAHPAFRSRNVAILYTNDRNRVIAFRRWSEDEDFVVVGSLGNRPWSGGYTIDSRHIRDGVWQEVLSSNAEAYGGDGFRFSAATASSNGRLTFGLPAPGIVVLRRSSEGADA